MATILFPLSVVSIMVESLTTSSEKTNLVSGIGNLHSANHVGRVGSSNVQEISTVNTVKRIYLA
jgi:hypothetical protein